MQRWMFYAGIGFLSLILIGVGAFYGLKEYRLGKDSPRWVPLPLSVDTPLEQQKEFAAKIREEFTKEPVLRMIVTNAKLKDGFMVASDDEALKELKARMFIEVGMCNSPSGRVPSVNLGMKGTVREREVLDAACMEMAKMFEVKK